MYCKIQWISQQNKTGSEKKSTVRTGYCKRAQSFPPGTMAAQRTAYKRCLVEAMNYMDQPGERYTKETEFTQAQLAAVTPEALCRYFNFRLFGVPDPPDGHDLVPQHRSNTLKYWKKAISYSMPNNIMVWNKHSGVGNATRSGKINKLSKYVKKKETRKQGVPSQARRATKHLEFVRIHQICKELHLTLPQISCLILFSSVSVTAIKAIQQQTRL